MGTHLLTRIDCELLARLLSWSLTTNRLVRVQAAVVSAGFFKTLRATLIAGRTFTEDEDSKVSPVAVISASQADRISRTNEARSERLSYSPGIPMTVIGVAPGGFSFREARISLAAPTRGQNPQRRKSLVGFRLGPRQRQAGWPAARRPVRNQRAQ